MPLPSLPFSSPLSSLSSTPSSTPQSTPTKVAAGQATAHVSPSRPNVYWKSRLNAAITTVSFTLTPKPDLVCIPYPEDASGIPIPVAQLIAHSKTHVWPDSIKCFCSIRDGLEHSVKIFAPRTGEHAGDPCLACTDWDSAGRDGCRYWVNLRQLFATNDMLDWVPKAIFPERLRRGISAPPFPLHPRMLFSGPAVGDMTMNVVSGTAPRAASTLLQAASEHPSAPGGARPLSTQAAVPPPPSQIAAESSSSQLDDMGPPFTQTAVSLPPTYSEADVALGERVDEVFGRRVDTLRAEPGADTSAMFDQAFADSVAEVLGSSGIRPAAGPSTRAQDAGPSAPHAGPSGAQDSAAEKRAGKRTVGDYLVNVQPPMKPGYVTSIERLWTPSQLDLKRIEETPIPSTREVEEVLFDLSKPHSSGVHYHRLMSVLGGCQYCDRVMTIDVLVTHDCTAPAPEAAPRPAKRKIVQPPPAPPPVQKRLRTAPVKKFPAASVHEAMQAGGAPAQVPPAASTMTVARRDAVSPTARIGGEHAQGHYKTLREVIDVETGVIAWDFI
ncbi:hypothetical protein OH77DRAFT_1518650 [Trametes cingulata]|nr:hypothetical protein OH77DRAFT_1518650 [Trametes cingulata]